MLKRSLTHVLLVSGLLGPLATCLLVSSWMIESRTLTQEYARPFFDFTRRLQFSSANPPFMYVSDTFPMPVDIELITTDKVYKFPVDHRFTARILGTDRQRVAITLLLWNFKAHGPAHKYTELMLEEVFCKSSPMIGPLKIKHPIKKIKRIMYLESDHQKEKTHVCS